MPKIEIDIDGDFTVAQGYFVFSGFDLEGRRISGAQEYPFNFDDDPELHDPDAIRVIGLLTFFRDQLIAREAEGFREGDG